MAKASLSSLVERLAEAESHLGRGSGGNGGSSSGGGNSSRVASEERDSAVAGMDDLEKASDVSRRSNRSGVDSDTGRPHGMQYGGSGSELGGSNLSSGVGKRGDGSGSLGSLGESSLSERLSALLSNSEDLISNHTDKANLARDILQQLVESQEAQRQADERLRQTEQALSSLQTQHRLEMADMQVELTKKDQEKEHRPVHSSSEPQLKSGLGQDVAKQDPFHLPDPREEENALLRKQLRTVRQQLADVENERDVLRRNMKSHKESHSNQLASLKAQLQAAKAQQDGEDPCQGLTKQLDLMQAQNQEMLEELSELRLKVPKDQVVKKNQVGDLQMMLDSASLKLEQSEEQSVQPAGSSAPHLLNKQNAANKRKNLSKKMGSALSKLDAIEEDLDSVNESCNPTFTVSSDAGGGGGVGDMDDFDDEIDISGQLHTSKAMQDALKQEKINVQTLQEELASKEAHYSSKIGRLTELLQTARKHQASTQEEVVAMKQMVGEDAKRTSQVDSLSKLLEAAQAKNAAYEELSQQVTALKESKRITEARAEDLKHALISEERKHKREKDELAHKLLKGGSIAPEDSEVEELRSRLRSAEEERNVLYNNFEGKEVKYKTEIEDMKQEMEEAKRRNNADIRKLEADKDALEMTVKEVQERQSQVKEPIVPAASPQNALLSLLRCPPRNSGGSEGSRAKPAYCQEMCWKVVSAISGTVALWCSMGDYTILQASREANRIWGSATLQGKSVFALASGPSSAAWLRKAFNAHQRIAEMETGDRGPLGFVVRDLGCEAFITKDGTSFDSSVITAHFPREVTLAKESALLVIMEPQNRGFSGPSAPHSSRSQTGRNDSRMRSGRQRSGTSEVSASSVSPSDSASNVIGRMW